MRNLFQFRSSKKRRRRIVQSRRNYLRMPQFTWLRKQSKAAWENVKVYQARMTRSVRDALSVTASTLIRAIMSPFESLVTVTVEDEVVRVVVSRGYRVTQWSEVPLPTGTVVGGSIVDASTLQDVMASSLGPVLEGFHFGDRRLAIAISGRNYVYSQLKLFVPDGTDLAKAANEALRSDLELTSGEMVFDWEIEATTTLEGSGKTRVAQEMKTDVEQVPNGKVHEIYGIGLRRGIVERNAEDLSIISRRIAGIHPKILALAAAANELSAIVIDVEHNVYSVIVVKNGLPAVVRESSFDPAVRRKLLAITIETEVSNSIEYLKSFNDGIELPDDMPVFISGSGASDEELATQLKSELSYQIAEMPRTLRAPADFPFNRFASNVGVALVAGKRFWQLTAVPLVNQPNFDLRPEKFRPRPVPVKGIATAGVAVAVGAGLFFGYEATQSRLTTADGTRAQIQTLKDYSEQIRTQSIELRASRAELGRLQSRNDELKAETELLKVRDNGFADTMNELFNGLPEGVVLSSVRDEGQSVTLEVLGEDHRSVLEYADGLNDSDLFLSVHVDRVTQLSSNDPNAGPGGVRAAVELRRLSG